MLSSCVPGIYHAGIEVYGEAQESGTLSRVSLHLAESGVDMSGICRNSDGVIAGSSRDSSSLAPGKDLLYS